MVSKADLPAEEGALERLKEMGLDFLHVSTMSGEGLEELEAQVRAMLAKVEEVLAAHRHKQQP